MAYDIAVVVVTSILAAITVAVIFTFIWFYQHPDEYGQSYFYKIILVCAKSEFIG